MKANGNSYGWLKLFILLDIYTLSMGFSVGKDLPANQETWVRFLVWEDPLEKGKATHSSILAWRIPWTEDLRGYSPWDHKELDMTMQLTFLFLWVP